MNRRKFFSCLAGAPIAMVSATKLDGHTIYRGTDFAVTSQNLPEYIRTSTEKLGSCSMVYYWEDQKIVAVEYINWPEPVGAIIDRHNFYFEKFEYRPLVTEQP